MASPMAMYHPSSVSLLFPVGFTDSADTKERFSLTQEKRPFHQYTPISLQWLHRREEKYVADGGAVGEEHDQAVDADADPAGGGQTIL